MTGGGQLGDPSDTSMVLQHSVVRVNDISTSRPYAISKTNQEFPLTERKSSSYRRVKLLFLFPLARGGGLPFAVVGCDRCGVPTDIPFRREPSLTDR